MSSVWIVNHYGTDPAQTGSGSRHFSLARRLSQLGWDPVILAASAEHNTSRQRLTGRAKFGTSDRDGVTFRWIRAQTYSGNGPARILNMLQFTARVLRRRSLKDLAPPDVVIGSTVHPLAAWAGSRLAARYRVPFVFEIRDLWPQTLIDMGKLKRRSPAAVALRALERHLCNRAAAVVTLLENASDYLEEIGVPREKVFWISNGTSVDEFAATPAPSTGKFTFLYFGSMGLANGLEAILEGYADASGDRPGSESRLVLVGDGPQRSALENLSRRLGLGETVEWRQPIPKAEIPDLAATAHCLVLNVLNLDVYRYGISMNKLFDYMAASRPILIASDVPNPVREADGGISVRGNDAEGIAKAMRAMMAASERTRERWGRNAAIYVRDHFDYNTLGEKLDAVLRAAVSERRISTRPRQRGE
jgi:glycosyltransferase involved in cell wall biosynthesis